jgi:hypothetical protein
MTKHLLLSAAILSASLPISAALAQSPGRGGEHHAVFSAVDAAAFMNARIAALKVGLELTPAQEKLWPSFEAALRDMDKARHELREKSKEAREQGDMPAMIRATGKLFAARAAEMEKFADAVKPLYDTLDEAQKRRFGALLHMMHRPFGPRHMGMGPGRMGSGGMGSGGMGPGPRPEQAPDDDDD